MKDELHEIDVYCDGTEGRKCPNAASFRGKTREGAIYLAQRAGWTIDNTANRYDWCPKCWEKMKGNIG